ncbi:hypothetical protein BO79DRAFT_40640 [Aspergillus costaricaensis CBS 115574]|uniref:Uncharacterized protein n=1 Tax=Aspergillus costaricaensis CBS 115574 TaxID=1448317 RepID=A0ACD1I6Y5_9EURO|nr:hypothetical protein BO79DRAFT_40640 [Aspergillus costaricaensis CBS 115574]RAK86042.1 hypothetical protein BO79DRAFT_40640 [Aspergillus costaricaensis CBS 115574]
MDSRLIPIQQHPCCCLEIGLPTKQVRTVFTPNGTGFIVAYPHVAHNGLMLLPVHSLFALPSIPLLPSIYLSPSFAPLGPSWSREKVQTPGSVPTRTPDRFPNKAFWVPRPSGSPSVALLWGASQRRVSMDVLCSRLSLNCPWNIGRLMRVIPG